MMRATFGNIGKAAAGRAALAVATATGLAASGFLLTATPALAKKKDKEEKPTNSKEFAQAAGPIQKSMQDLKALKDKGTSDADMKTAAQAVVPELTTAEAAIKTPLDRLIAGQWAVGLGGYLADVGMRQRGMKNMLDSGLVPEENRTQYQFYLGNFAYANKDYPTAVQALTPVVAANFKDDAAAEILADSYVKQNQPAKGLDALQTAVDARKAAGEAIPEGWFKRANLIAYQNKLGPQAIKWSTMMVANDPTPINWLGAAQLVREFGDFTKEESLDLGRLLLRSGGLNNDPKFVEREYVEYIQSADPRRLPGEVAKVAKMGIAAGALPANDTFVKDSLSQAEGRIPSDKASLPGLEKDARAAKNGVTPLAAGDAFLSYDMPAKAEEMYQIALTKGGIDVPRALTRLGIAQSDEGKYAEAKATFEKITGARAPLARLWEVYVDQKAKAGTANDASAS